MKELSPIEWTGNSIKVLDQTLLPRAKKYITCRNYREIAKAIKEMKLRGAPLIGVVAALAIAMQAKKSKAKSTSKFMKELKTAAGALLKTRPTAVNLKWAIGRLLNFVAHNRERRISSLKEMVIKESNKIYKEDIENNKAIGRYGAELIRNNDTILTHCNAGALATAGYGTAIGVIRAAASGKKKIKVLVDETRPYLQGARLTTFELEELKIPHYLITDNMAGYFMKAGKVSVVIVGADRITANGDAANKIGTYSLAVLAHENNIPFYVAAPSSTIDFNLKNGDDIPIEERSGEEVKVIMGKEITGRKTKALHPAFDVTPSKYISAVITEKGVIRAPYEANLERTFSNKEVVVTL